MTEVTGTLTVDYSKCVGIGEYAGDAPELRRTHFYVLVKPKGDTNERAFIHLFSKTQALGSLTRTVTLQTGPYVVTFGDSGPNGDDMGPTSVASEFAVVAQPVTVKIPIVTSGTLTVTFTPATT